MVFGSSRDLDCCTLLVIRQSSCEQIFVVYEVLSAVSLVENSIREAVLGSLAATLHVEKGSDMSVSLLRRHCEFEEIPRHLHNATIAS